KRAPVRGFFLEGVENDVAAKSVPKFQQVAPVGIRDDRAVATCECRTQQLANSCRLTRAGRPDDLEVLGLIQRIERDFGDPKTRRARTVAAPHFPASARTGQEQRASSEALRVA